MRPDPLLYATQPTDDEQRLLRAAEPYLELAGTEGWQHLKDFMQALCDDATHKIDLNQSSNPRVAQVAILRRQQRVAMMSAIVRHVEGLVRQRADIIERLAEQDAAAAELAEEVRW